MTTVKMPRQHNRNLHEIQRQRSWLEDAKEVALTLGSMFFFAMCLWGIAELYDWGCKTYVENQVLKSELHEEKTAYKARFMQEQIDKAQAERERQNYIKALCKRDERGCKIMMVQWRR